MLVWEILGAIVGAGFASGREIAAFFAQHRPLDFAGAILAAIMMLWLADTQFPSAWEKRWLALCYKAVITTMLIATGGAMLAAAGEMSALMLPIRHADWFGGTLTFIAAWFMAHRSASGLAWLGKGLLLLLGIMFTAALMLPSSSAGVMTQSTLPQAAAYSLCYSGFNAALLLPVLHRHATRKRRQLLAVGAVIAALLLAGNLIFRLHPEVLQETMPFIALVRRLGKAGFYLCSSCMYLSILSTLTACLRGLGQKQSVAVCVLIVSLIGFEQVIEQGYRFIGGLCCLLLLWAKFRNCSGRAFISP